MAARAGGGAPRMRPTSNVVTSSPSMAAALPMAAEPSSTSSPPIPSRSMSRTEFSGIGSMTS
jgi:hypothetical protein